MIYSMTGYAVAARELENAVLNLELRSVNHRYLDIQFRLPDELRSIEPALRETLAARLNRGKIECRISFTPVPGRKSAELDQEVLKQVLELNRRVRAALPDARSLSAADLLRWPGMLGSDALDVEELRRVCQALLDKVLEDFTRTRGREGEKLKAILLERAATVEKHLAEVAPRMPQVIAAFQEKLATRLKEALANADEDRIRQEVILFANKIDVDEELTRLTTHIAELRRVLDRGGAVGKRLDFLMQELNREANTLGSKAADVSVTQVSMELKLLIEQMREQIQNIE
ncbi:MAG TPA: YicC/YloC family endoribonuclease [Burkholderiales bacterium]|nr:YicC/YloC family endoribonuclease [Burkholderiales bacterium]